jgi:hypothetical protein
VLGGLLIEKVLKDEKGSELPVPPLLEEGKPRLEKGPMPLG